MKPLDFYQLGIELAEAANTEARHRTVVNRLYYGLHHEACCRFFRVNPSADPLRRGSRHTYLRRMFNDPTDRVSANVARLLRSLELLRAECDYRLSQNIVLGGAEYQPHQAMEMAVWTARELLNALEEYSPGAAEDGCNCPAQ